MLISERGALAGFSDQIRTGDFAKLYSFFPSIWLGWFSCSFLVTKEKQWRKLQQNNDQMSKWPNFCSIWNLQANSGKNFPAKYVDVY